MVYIPIPRLVATSPRVMDPNGRTWERIRAMTRQPQQYNTFNIVGKNVCKTTVI